MFEQLPFHVIMWYWARVCVCIHTHISYDTYKLWYIYDPVVLWFLLPFSSSLLRVVDGPVCFPSFSSISSSPGLIFLFLFSSFFGMKAKTKTDEYKSYQPAQQQRKRGQSGQLSDTLVPNCLPSKQPTLYCRTEAVCKSREYATAPQRIIAALHVSHWPCFRYMHIYSVSIYYTFYMLCVALCTWQSILTIHYSFCETFKRH